MTIQRIRLPFLIVRMLPLLFCVCLNGTPAHAQTPADSSLQADPPVSPRTRKPRPAFTVKADPDAKPLPLPTPMPVAEPTPTRSSLPPTPKELADRQARLTEKQRETAESDHQQEVLGSIGKVVGFLVVVGLGVFAVTDIARQIRRSKQTAHDEEDGEDNEWEP